MPNLAALIRNSPLAHLPTSRPRGKRIFTSEQVDTIRYLSRECEVPAAQIARNLRVSTETIYRILNEATYISQPEEQEND